MSIAATESKSEKLAITNIFMQLGSDITQRNLTWFSLSRDLGVVTYAKASKMIEGEFPENATKVGAYRANSLRSFKSGYYYNKATMTDQLSCGEDKSEIYTILLPGESYCYEIGEVTDNFDFVFISDPQIGVDNEKGLTENDRKLIAEQGESWGRTLKQITTDPIFSDAEFVLCAGDQINTDNYVPSYEENELMYDSYINHDEIPTLAMTSLLGNHDNWSQGNHYQHFNEPNYTKNPSTGTYYGLTQTNGNINGADYWFTYNSVLFVVLNTSTMTTSW